MKKQNRLLSLILSLFLLLFTLVPQSALTVKAEGNSEMAVHFIDVGQGNAILVQSGGQNLLYDGGDQSHADLIISYLQEQNVENIDYENFEKVIKGLEIIRPKFDNIVLSGCLTEIPLSGSVELWNL